jgi:2-polyprenyl-3-methyl-5-hydroxy-6-metoxy-1,4-benzoquinol methylase
LFAGIFFLLHASLNGCDVLGVDIDQQNIDTAKKLSQFYGAKANFEIGAIESVKRQFDIVLCLSMLHYIEDKEDFFREVYIRCKKYFILETPLRDSDCITDETPKDFIFLQKTLLSLLSKYFIIAGISKSNLADRHVYYLVRKTDLYFCDT